MLEIKGVNKNFIKKQALKDINLELENGIYGLLGENGAGKTTLMKMMATLDRPTSGTLTYDGKNILNNKDYLINMGYMPQDIEIYAGFTAYDYLEYMAILKGMEKKGLEKKIDEILEFVNLEDVKKKKIKTFSGGMKRRIGIAQAIINNPKVLILDEPTAGLDPYERVRFSNILSNMSKDRIILFSTHIVSDIEAITNKVIILTDGEIKNIGLINNIISELNNRVRIMETSLEEVSELQKNSYLVRIKNEGDKLSVRFIERGDNMSKGEIVSPTLEDYFVYVGALKGEKSLL
ncbi:MAG: ABC transporter ATP-binding protein [Peptoanaerobacter stomatis]|uniref:ABC transporter ATP-binding protein n=1 Tax=Peptoanaerobacter stomatis TaxID=796937 RepID=UPI003F9F3D83